MPAIENIYVASKQKNVKIWLYKCDKCEHRAWCDINVWLGLRLPCQPKGEEDIAVTREIGDLVKSWA